MDGDVAGQLEEEPNCTECEMTTGTSFLDSLDGKLLLCVMLTLVVVLILLLVVLLCWRYYHLIKRSSRTAQPSCACTTTPSTPHATCSCALDRRRRGVDGAGTCVCQSSRDSLYDSCVCGRRAISGLASAFTPRASPEGIRKCTREYTNNTFEEERDVSFNVCRQGEQQSPKQTTKKKTDIKQAPAIAPQAPVVSVTPLGSRVRRQDSDVCRETSFVSNVVSEGIALPVFPDSFPNEDDFLPLNIQCPSLFDTFPSLIRDLFVPAARSEKRTVAGKLVVSLARQVDHKGELLVLDNMGISLLVPPGAVARGRRQMVSLVLSWELSDFPHMSNTQALVSPVVYCGPHGLRLDKPCVLSYKHCAFDPRMIQVVSSETELTEEKHWQVVCSAEDSSGKVSLTTDECRIHLQHFSLFTCLQTPPEGSTGKKWLQIAAFCAPLHRSVHHYQVRVYFLNKTPCALQWAIHNESKYGFRLACPEHTFLFDGCGDDVYLTVGYVSRGWCAVREAHHEADSDDEERVSFHAIWHGKCPHLAFCFKRVCLADTPRLLSSSSSPLAAHEQPASDVMSSDTALPALVQTHVREINLDLSIYQHSHRNNPDRINLLLTEVTEPDLTSHPPPSAQDPTCSTPTFLPTCDRHGVSITMPTMHVHGGVIKGKVKLDPHRCGANVLVDFEREADCVEDLPFPSLTKLVGKSCEGQMNVYPQELKVKLKMRLDPPCPFGNDWRMLASTVGLDQWIPWLSSNDNPTLSVLSYMETQQMDLVCLYYKLTDISRCDAASDVQHFLHAREIATPPVRLQHVEHSDGPGSSTGTSDVIITPIATHTSE